MNKRIIYQNEGGGVNVLIPAPDCGLTLDEITAKVIAHDLRRDATTLKTTTQVQVINGSVSGGNLVDQSDVSTTIFC